MLQVIQLGHSLARFAYISIFFVLFQFFYSVSLLSEPLPPDLALVRQTEKYLAEGRKSQTCKLLQQRCKNCPNNITLLYQLGVCYYRAGNLFFAQSVVKRVLDVAPEFYPAHRLAALILLATGEFASARREIDLYVESGGDPRDSVVSFVRGAVEFDKGNFTSALFHFRDTLEHEQNYANEQIRRAANLYIDSIYVMKGLGRAGFELSVSSGARYDSNVILEPTQPPPFLEGDNRAVGAVTAISAALRPVRGVNTLQGSAFLYRTFYFSEEGNDFNTTLVTAGLHWLSSRFYDLKIGYDFSLTFLDGGPRVEEPDFYVFQEKHGIVLSFALTPSDHVKVVPRYALEWRFYDTLRRNVRGHVLDLNVMFELSRQIKLFFTPRFVCDTAMSVMDAYDLVGGGGRLALSALMPWSVSLSAISNFERRDYVNSAGKFGELTKRVDNYITGSIALTRPVYGSLSLTASVSYMRNLSSIAVYDYSRLTVDFVGSWRF